MYMYQCIGGAGDGDDGYLAGTSTDLSPLQQIIQVRAVIRLYVYIYTYIQTCTDMCMYLYR